ncbi:hypothetical protein DB346_17630 [Verrucomicrobia bacterium LW23]|nr:hypothetical protein DB346_17630 [Verrucomicrobia bacterium LW23]
MIYTRFPVLTLLLLLAGASACLAADTNAPAVAAPASTGTPDPAARVEYITAMTAPYLQESKYKLTDEELTKYCKPFTLNVINEAGKPVAGAEVRMFDAIRPTWSQDYQTGDDGVLSHRVWPGPVRFIIWGSGYPAQVVMYDTGVPDGKATITLSRGRAYRVRCVDAATQAPVPDATVELRMDDVSSYALISITNKEGWATFSHISDSAPMEMTVWERDSVTVRQSHLRLDGPELAQPVQLRRVKPLRVTVTEAGTGKPVPGLELSLYNTTPSFGFHRPDWTASPVVTNAQGEADARGLEPGRVYKIQARGKSFDGEVRVLLDESRPTARLEVRRKIPVTLRVINIPPQPENQLKVSYMEYAGSSGSGNTHTFAVKDGKVEFKKMCDHGARVTLTCGEYVVELASAVTESVLEMDYKGLADSVPKPVRLTVRLQPPAGEAPPQGELTVGWSRQSKADKKEKSKLKQSGSEKVEIRDGVAVAEVPANTSAYVRGEKMYGGYLKDPNSRNISLEGEAKTITLPVLPGGAIRAQVLTHEGRLAVGARAYARNINMGSGEGDVPLNSTGGNSSKPVLPSTWHASPTVPFDAEDTYTLRARQGFLYVVDKQRFAITEANYLHQARLTLPQPRMRTIRVVDTDGKPVPELTMTSQVKCSLFPSVSMYDWVTDGKGEIHLPMNPSDEEADAFQITLAPRESLIWQPLKQPVRFNKAGVATVTVRPGVRIFGRVVDTTRGKLAASQDLSLQWGAKLPAPGAPARKAAGGEDDDEDDDNDAGTVSVNGYAPVDSEGHFAISCVPNAKLTLSFSNLPDKTETVFLTGSSEQYTPNGKELIIEIRDRKPAKGAADQDARATPRPAPSLAVHP